MPVTKSAKKKLRKDKKRQKHNFILETNLEKLIKNTKKNPSLKKVQDAFSVIDKAAKKNIIHKNKASRIKRGLSKLIKSPKKAETKVVKKSPQKSKAAKK